MATSNNNIKNTQQWHKQKSFQKAIYHNHCHLGDEWQVWQQPALPSLCRDERYWYCSHSLSPSASWVPQLPVAAMQDIKHTLGTIAVAHSTSTALLISLMTPSPIRKHAIIAFNLCTFLIMVTNDAKSWSRISSYSVLLCDRVCIHLHLKQRRSCKLFSAGKSPPFLFPNWCHLSHHDAEWKPHACW